LVSISGDAFLRDTLLIIPTHNHPDTLALAVETAQNQTVADLGIVVIGDGVSDDTRDQLAPILAADSRVSFLDRPKAIRHGEEYRHEVIQASGATKIAYLGDDDLLFPDHIETLTELLDGHDFVNTLPIFINPDGSLFYLVSDLGNSESVAWHLDPENRRNTVSLTGVMHTRGSYVALPYGWRPAPQGRWTDHYMWEQFWSQPNFKGRTSIRATTAKFNQLHRDDMAGVARREELRAFAREMARPEFVKSWEQRVRECQRDTVVRLALENTALQENSAAMAAHGERVSHELEAARRQVEALISEKDSLQGDLFATSEVLRQTSKTLDEVLNSKSWKITAPFRRPRA
jgi:glycosyltransferase involved in cell wall biosynthesis